MKKLLIILMICLFSNAYATTIVNKNSYAVGYKIKHGETCTFAFEKGRLAPGEQVVWEGNAEVIPDVVCVFAVGKTSIIGTRCRGIKNKGSVVEIRNNGLFRGVVCECVEGCE